MYPHEQHDKLSRDALKQFIYKLAKLNKPSIIRGIQVQSVQTVKRDDNPYYVYTKIHALPDLPKYSIHKKRKL